MDRAEDGDDVHGGDTEPFPWPKAQIDREGRRGAGGENFDRLARLKYGDKQQAADGCLSDERQYEAGVQPIRTEPVEQRNGEAAAEPEEEDRQGLNDAV